METARESTVLAAAKAIADHHETLDLDPSDDRQTQLWHLVASLLEWCDEHEVDFDQTVSEVRADFIRP